MKTNQRRNFVAKRFVPRPVGCMKITDDGKIIIAGGGYYHDYCCGKRGHRRDKKGAKKFVNSRTRFHNRMALQRTVKEL